MTNTLAVTEYNPETDEFTVLVCLKIEKKIPAEEFAAMHSNSHNCRALMSAQDLAVADIFNRYFEEEPTDLVGRFVEF